MTRKVIIFGGYFNPPTNAHSEVIRFCLNLPGFSEVWVMPSGNRRDKSSSISEKDRLAMLNIMLNEEFGNEPRLRICNLELDLPRPSNTYQTSKELKSRYKDLDFWYVYGADAYRDMPNWEYGTELQRSLNMVVFERDDVHIPERKGIVKLKAPIQKGISSTIIRERANRDESIKGFVSQGVASYIEGKRLYKSSY